MECGEGFLFESSHLALRCNEDYLKLIKHLAALCSLRLNVLADYEIIQSEHQKMISDPIEFLENFKKGSIIFPVYIEIPEVSCSFFVFISGEIIDVVFLC